MDIVKLVPCEVCTEHYTVYKGYYFAVSLADDLLWSNNLSSSLASPTIATVQSISYNYCKDT